MAPGGSWLGVDVGTVRVGVARSDPHGVLATPLATLARDAAGDADVAELVALVREYNAVGVVVGLPVTLAGREGASAQLAREYGERLSRTLAEGGDALPVRYVDERLTTVAATRKLAQSGVRGSRAKRAKVDQMAAVELLQHWLDTGKDRHDTPG